MMEMRQEPQQQQTVRRERTMTVDAQWRADITRQMETSSKAQQDTALALERILGRLNAVERWQSDEEIEKRRREERRDERAEKQPDYQRANAALIFSAVMTLIYVATFLSQHWKP